MHMYTIPVIFQIRPVRVFHNTTRTTLVHVHLYRTVEVQGTVDP